MSARGFWYNINDSGDLNASEFDRFLKCLCIELEFSEVEQIVSIFGGKITYNQFKKIIKV